MIPTCPFSRLRRSRQGITEHNLTTAERKSFLVTLRRLAGSRGRLPDRMVITDEIEVSDVISAFGGFGEVRSGRYKGQPVAVKTARIVTRDNLQKIRKVSIDGTFTPTGARSQPLRPSDFTGKSFSGKCYPIRMSWDLLGFGKTRGGENLSLYQSGWSTGPSWSTSGRITPTD